MQWELTLIPLCLGLFMGLASLNGLTRKIEFWLWVLVALIIAITIGRNAVSSDFLQGLRIADCGFRIAD